MKTTHKNEIATVQEHILGYSHIAEYVEMLNRYEEEGAQPKIITENLKEMDKINPKVEFHIVITTACKGSNNGQD